VLNASGQLHLPKEICEEDQLRPGDAFDVRRVASGQYVLEKERPKLMPVSVVETSDGRLVFSGGGRITSEMVQST
jgi:bifunctional DNA-binding transcriptional regulator/antitoxin component of YhaV-PrlF toxin-antitoxin module